MTLCGRRRGTWLYGENGSEIGRGVGGVGGGEREREMRVRARDIMNRGHSRGHNRLHVHNSKLTSLERAPFLTHVLQRTATLLAHSLCPSVDCLAGTRHIISVCKHAMATRTNIKVYRLNLPHSPSDSNAHSLLAARHSRPLQNHHSIGQLVEAPVLNCPFLSPHPSTCPKMSISMLARE